MPSVIVRRIRFTETFQAVSEFLRREETLFVEPEWSWTTDKALAFVFPSCALAEVAGKEHRGRDEDGTLYDIFPIVSEDPERKKRLERRESDRIATALAGVEGNALAVTVDRAGGEPRTGSELASLNKAVAAKLSPRPPTRRRRKPEQATGIEVPRTTDHRGADVWKKVCQARVSPEECFAREERRHLA